MGTGFASPLLAVRHGRRPHERAARVAFILAVVLLAGVATALTASVSAAAAGPPEALIQSATQIAGEFGRGSPFWARYVITTKAQVTSLLGLSGLQQQAPQRVYLVVMHGPAFRHAGTGQTGEYLAYVFWQADDGTATAEGFTVTNEPVAMKTVGVSRPLRLGHVGSEPTTPLTEYLWIFLFWFLPGILLAAAAVAAAWRRRSGWPYAAGACVAVAVAALQIWMTLRSMRGGLAWDPVFHGTKVGILALVVIVDAAATFMLLRARSQREDADATPSARLTLRHAGLVLLVITAVSYAVMPPPLIGIYAYRSVLWYAPPLLLLLAVALCAWRWRNEWPWRVGGSLAAIIACVQAYAMARAAWLGWSSLGTYRYAALVADVAAAATLLLASRRRRAGEARPARLAASHAGFLLLMVAAVLYVATLPYLGTTGE